MNNPVYRFSRNPIPTNCSDLIQNRKDLLKYFVQAGMQAPSWYNVQPWRFVILENAIELYLDPTQDQTIFDWENYNSLLACGAAIQNIKVVAKNYGFILKVKFFPDKENLLLIARFDFDFHSDYDKKNQVSDSEKELEVCVWNRHTNALLFEKTPVDQKNLEQLTHAISADSGVKLHLFTDEKDKLKIFELVSCADHIRYSRRELHEYLHQMIRWTSEEAHLNRIGYTIPSMGACGFGEQFFRFTKPWSVMKTLGAFGAASHLAKRSNEGLKHCGAIGMLSFRGNTKKDLLNIGVEIENVWLRATQLGLELQPHSIINLFHWIWQNGGTAVFNSSEHEVLKKAFDLYFKTFSNIDFTKGEMGHFLFRIGKGPKVQGYTLRKEL